MALDTTNVNDTSVDVDTLSQQVDTSATDTPSVNDTSLVSNVNAGENTTEGWQMSSLGQTNQDYIEQMYDAQLNATNTAYENAYNQNVATQEQQNAKIDPAYTESANSIGQQYDIAQKNLGMQTAQYGINSGAGSQMFLSLTNARNAALAKNEQSRQEAILAGEQALADLEISYKSQIAEALANNELEKAQALYQEITNDQNRQEVIAQAMAQMGDYSGYEKLYGSETADAMQKAYDDAKAEENAAEAASKLAEIGDFSSLGAIYGWTDEQISEARAQWLFQNGDYAYAMGEITAEQYYGMFGAYPAGYDASIGGRLYDGYGNSTTDSGLPGADYDWSTNPAGYGQDIAEIMQYAVYSGNGNVIGFRYVDEDGVHYLNSKGEESASDYLRNKLEASVDDTGYIGGKYDIEALKEKYYEENGISLEEREKMTGKQQQELENKLKVQAVKDEWNEQHPGYDFDEIFGRSADEKAKELAAEQINAASQTKTATINAASVAQRLSAAKATVASSSYNNNYEAYRNRTLNAMANKDTNYVGASGTTYNLSSTMT